ncbi:MAG TPA: nucleotidyltransferase family protein [Candidatus Solibacter sp.]|nr:nucleotidyltransferase family protein [Candidatus Solibacter sp.]
MKAMILAAGLGTRLRPLTDARPKALVELNGRTLLEITITRLAAFGVTEFIVNVHHHAQMVVDYLHSKKNFGFRIEISREDDQLLDTGGGLQKAAWFFQENPSRLDEPFFLHNVDVISNIDLSRMLQFHKQNQALATLAVQSRPSSRQLLFDEQLQLSGRRISGHDSVILSAAKNPASISAPPATSGSLLSTHHSPPPQSEEPSPLLPLAFSGIHVISPRLLLLLTESTPVFSVIDTYLRLASQSQKILAFRHDSSYWRDLGKPSDLAQASLDLQQNLPH